MFDFTSQLASLMYLLVIDDNATFIATFYDYFEPLGHVVDSAYNARSGLEFASEKHYDAIVVSGDLAGTGGPELCQHIRHIDPVTPICLISSLNSVQHTIRCFKSGADDCLTKPVDFPELDIRIQARVRRNRGDIDQNTLQVGELSLDLKSGKVEREGKHIKLAPVPTKILEILMRASPGVLSKLEMERRLWGNNRPGTDALKVHIHTLRAALDKPFKTPFLHTVHGVGYQLISPGNDPLTFSLSTHIS